MSKRELLKGEHLDLVARTYNEVMFFADLHKTRPKPAKVIAAKFDRPIGTANRWIKAAKEAGLITGETFSCECVCHYE